MLAIFSMALRLFWMLTPFFVLAMYLNLSDGESDKRKREIVNRCVLAVFTLSMLFYFLGRPLFEVLGITLDGFRIGAGVTLFLTALDCIAGNPTRTRDPGESKWRDVSIVPLAIPFAVGPGMIGTIMIIAIEAPDWVGRGVFAAGLTIEVILLWLMLRFATVLQRMLGDSMIQVLSRITGLFLAALAGNMIVVGVRNIWLDI